MISGIGVDIVEISRMEKSIENSRFLTRNFTTAENEYFMLKNYNIHTIAAAFAAKEAVSKAFGTGIRGFNLTDIEILHDKLGKPYVNLYNKCLEIANGAKINLSLSHTGDYAVAFVVMER